MCDTGPLVTDIQRYSIHDGEGIRTTVFFKGCPLSCKWCHNPETQKFGGEILFYEERCQGCGACVRCCPEGAIQMDGDFLSAGRLPVSIPGKCRVCGQCAEECIYNARELCGKFRTVEELVQKLARDNPFYETSGGGVTLSGGEVMVQDMVYVEVLLKTLRRKGISVCVDTCGEAPWENFRRVLPYVDTFLYDLKMMDSRKHEQYTGRGNGRILQNLQMLSEQKAKIWLRLPLIGGVNDSEGDLARLEQFLAENEIHFQRINILPYHNTGSGKYGRLGQKYEGQNFQVPNQQCLKEWCLRLGKFGTVFIGG